MLKHLRVLLHLYGLLCVTNLFALETIYIPRADESVIEAYFSVPQNETSFPVILLIQGSDAESVIQNHTALSQRFTPHGIAIISVEKRGINSHGINMPEFNQYDFFEYRLQDFSMVLKVLEEDLISRWNGQLILLGGSEGGKIAPRLSVQNSHFVSAAILVGCGGGIPFADEMKFQIETALANQNLFLKVFSKIRSALLPNEVETQFARMLSQPDSLEIWCQKTYRWWASYLRYDPLPEIYQMNMPVYMIHGALDPNIPVQSADKVKEAFEIAGKHNLTYARYEDLGHALKGRDDVYLPLVEWVKRIFYLHQSSNEVLKDDATIAL